MTAKDIIDEYTSCVNAEEQMREEMERYKLKMREARKSRDTARYNRIRMEADILAKSMAVMQKTREEREQDVMWAFQEGKPDDSVDSGSNSSSPVEAPAGTT